MNFERPGLVLAIYPNARGFAFVLFEGVDALIDWGISELRRDKRDARCFNLVERLLQKHRPDVLVLRHMPDGRDTALSRRLVGLAKHKGIPAVSISRAEVRHAFGNLGKATRYAIMSEIVRRLPMSASFHPGRRKIWNGEDRRMGFFDATALAITFLAGSRFVLPDRK